MALGSRPSPDGFERVGEAGHDQHGVREAEEPRSAAPERREVTQHDGVRVEDEQFIGLGQQLRRAGAAAVV